MIGSTDAVVGIVARRTNVAVLTLGALVLLGARCPATANTSTQIIRQDVAGQVFLNPCTGEHMTITSGTLQLLVQVTDDDFPLVIQAVEVHRADTTVLSGALRC
jgi:hypothetical protein